MEGVRQRERLQEGEAREGGGRAPTLELCQPFTLQGGVCTDCPMLFPDHRSAGVGALTVELGCSEEACVYRNVRETLWSRQTVSQSQVDRPWSYVFTLYCMGN